MIYVILRGRLGNQLFQYSLASKLADQYAKKIKVVEIYDKSRLDSFILNGKTFKANKFETYVIKAIIKIYEKAINLLYLRNVKETDIDQERYDLEIRLLPKLAKCGLVFFQSGYVEIPELNVKNIILYGFFESEKYFAERSKTVKAEFKLKNSEGIQKEINDISGLDATCLHIRMGDYVANPIFGVCSIDYYQKAVNYIIENESNPVFVIFSDEIERIKECIDFSNARVLYEKVGLADSETLMYMSACKNFIMSNSTFSWWAQYLSEKDGIVIAPNKWLNIKGPFNDIYLEKWVLLPT